MVHENHSQQHSHPDRHLLHYQVPPVDLNTADKREIEKLPMVGPELAQAIIDARPFNCWGEVAAVKGLSREKIIDLWDCGADLR